jgi:hypothetical protein
LTLAQARVAVLERSRTAVQGHAQEEKLTAEPPAGTADQGVAPQGQALGQAEGLVKLSRSQDGRLFTLKSQNLEQLFGPDH